MSVRTHATPTRDARGPLQPPRKGPVRAASRQSRAAEDGKQPPHDGDGHAASRHAAIAREAYFLAERRGFAPGFELDDWLAAEAALDSASPHASADDPAGGPADRPQADPAV